MQFMCGQVPEKTRKVSSALRRTQIVFSTGPVNHVPCSVTVTILFWNSPTGYSAIGAQFDGLVSRGFPPRQIVDDAEGSAATHHKPAEDFERLAAALLFDFGRSHAPRSSHRNENPACLRIEGVANPLSSVLPSLP